MTDEEYEQFVETNLQTVIDNIMELDLPDFDKSSLASNLAASLVLSAMNISFRPSDELLETLSDEIYEFLTNLMLKVRRITKN